MKLSQSFFYTLRENAKDEDSISSNLLVRAGMIKKTSNGIYMIKMCIRDSSWTDGIKRDDILQIPDQRGWTNTFIEINLSLIHI